METVKGIVKAVRKDKKGVLLDNDKWYSNKFAAEVVCNKGDEVEIAFETKGIYNNHETIKVLSKAKGSKVSSEYDPTTMLVSYAKDLVVASMSTDKRISLDNATILVLAEYFKVKKILEDPSNFLTESKIETIEVPVVKPGPEPPEQQAEY